MAKQRTNKCLEYIKVFIVCEQKKMYLNWALWKVFEKVF